MNGGGTSTKIIDPYAGTGVRDLYGRLQGAMQPHMAGMFNMPTSPMYAGTQGIYNQLFGQAPNILPQYQQAMGGAMAGAQPYFAQAGEALGAAASPYDTDAGRRMWEAAYVKPSQQVYQDFMRQTAEKYAGMGEGSTGSGAFNTAMAEGARDLSTRLAGNLQNILYSGEQSRLGRLPGIAQGYQNLAGAPMNLALAGYGGQMNLMNSMMGMGGVQQQLAQQQQYEPYQRYGMMQQGLGQFMPMAMNEPPMTVVQQEQGPGLAGMLGPMLGGIGYGMGGPLGGAIGSSLFGSQTQGSQPDYSSMTGAGTMNPYWMYSRT
jgi:hypothetical protein